MFERDFKRCQYRNCHKKSVAEGMTLRYCQRHWNWYTRVNEFKHGRASFVKSETDGD